MADYLSAKPGLPFEVQAFSAPESLEEYARDHPVDMLLISPDLLSEEVKELKIDRIMLLSEEETGAEVDYPSAYKYQSSESILREVLSCYTREEAVTDSAPWCGRRTRIYGVYSPIKRCGKTGFALMLGQVLAEQGRVLYLNFEEYSGFRELFGQEESDMSELMLHLLQEQSGLFGKLKELVRSLGKMDYIPPGVCHADFLELNRTHWERLLECIREEGLYDAVILDLGTATDALFQILEQCDAVYMPVKEDTVSQAKLQQFFWVCEGIGFQRWSRRMRKVLPPEEDFWQMIRQGNLEASVLYRYVKEVLEEKEEVDAGYWPDKGHWAGAGS